LNKLSRYYRIFADLSPTSLKCVTNRTPAGEPVILGEGRGIKRPYALGPQKGFIRTVKIRMDLFFMGLGGGAF
jgi:hypothetical protein